MAKLPENLADISTDFPVREEGDAELTIVKAELGESSTGKPMIKVQLECENEEGETVQIFENFVLTTNEGKKNIGSYRAFKRLVISALGEDAGNDPDFEIESLEGAKVNAYLEIEEDDKYGRRNRVKKYL